MLGLGNNLKKSGLISPGIITDSLVLKHKYDAASVVPVSDGAASFDSTDDYISVSETTLSVHDTAYSFAFWVNLKDTGWHPIFGDDDAFYNTIAIDDDNDRIIIEGSSDGDNMQWNTIQDPLVLGAWNHFAICLDGSGSAKAYQNGVELTMTADTIGSDLIFKYIGKGTSYFLGGYLCNVAYWSSQLTQAQIKSIMNKNYAGLTDSEKTNLVSWWNLDSKITSSSNGTENTAPITVYDNHNTTLGSELITNGDFSNGLTGWTTDGDVSVNASGISVFGSTGSDVYIYQDLGSTGNTYKITFDLIVSSGVMKLGTNTDFQYSYSAGTYTNESVYIVPTATNRFIFRRESGTLSATLDNISVKQVNGNIGTLS